MRSAGFLAKTDCVDWDMLAHYTAHVAAGARRLKRYERTDPLQRRAPPRLQMQDRKRDLALFNLVKYARISLGFVRENQRNRLIFLSSKRGHSGAKLLF